MVGIWVECDFGCFRLESPSGRLYQLTFIQPTPWDLFLYGNKVNDFSSVFFFLYLLTECLNRCYRIFFHRFRLFRHEFIATICWCNYTCMYDKGWMYLCLSSLRGNEHDKENGLSSHSNKNNETKHWNTTFWSLWTWSMKPLKVPWTRRSNNYILIPIAVTLIKLDPWRFSNRPLISWCKHHKFPQNFTILPPPKKC